VLTDQSRNCIPHDLAPIAAGFPSQLCQARRRDFISLYIYRQTPDTIEIHQASNEQNKKRSGKLSPHTVPRKTSRTKREEEKTTERRQKSIKLVLSERVACLVVSACLLGRNSSPSHRAISLNKNTVN
jgi:hypothetical protein